jgi:signal peptidase II
VATSPANPANGAGGQNETSDRGPASADEGATPAPPAAAADGARLGAAAVAPRARPRWASFITIVAVVIVLDQLSKAWIQANVVPGTAIRLVGDELRLIVSANTGALFGLFRDQAGLFALFSLGVVAVIIGYEARAGRSRYLTVTLGLLLGGALGNLADRVRLGHVVDFVDAGIGDLRFYTFNVADAAISAAILLLLILAIRPSLADTVDPRSEVVEPGG